MGSIPMFPKMYFNSYAYVISHYNILSSRKQPSIKIRLTKKTLNLIKIMYNVGAIKSYIIIKSSLNSKNYIRFSSSFYKNVPFFKDVKLVSTPSKKHTVTLKGLRLLSKMVGSSVIIISTSKGLFTHKKAIDRNLGGLIVCVLN